MDPIDILAGFYGRRSKAFEILVAHGELVALKAIKAAARVPHLKPDKINRFQSWVEMFEY